MYLSDILVLALLAAFMLLAVPLPLNAALGLAGLVTSSVAAAYGILGFYEILTLPGRIWGTLTDSPAVIALPMLLLVSHLSAHAGVRERPSCAGFGQFTTTILRGTIALVFVSDLLALPLPELLRSGLPAFLALALLALAGGETRAAAGLLRSDRWSLVGPACSLLTAGAAASGLVTAAEAAACGVALALILHSLTGYQVSRLRAAATAAAIDAAALVLLLIGAVIVRAAFEMLGGGDFVPAFLAEASLAGRPASLLWLGFAALT